MNNLQIKLFSFIFPVSYYKKFKPKCHKNNDYQCKQKNGYSGLIPGMVCESSESRRGAGSQSIQPQEGQEDLPVA